MGNRELCGAFQFKVMPCKDNTTRSSSKIRILKYILPSVISVASLAVIMVCLMRSCNKNSARPAQSSPLITVKRISYYEVLKSTNNFDEENLIGRGSFGSEYKGVFSDGTIAAIKAFNLDVEGTNKSFDTECQILCKIHHRNLVKPSNILLDEDMVAHVGDFGISKLFTEDQRISHTKTLGTIGYMAPEYGSTGLISAMADVYSYGIMLMETFIKKKPTDDIFIEELTMRKWVFEFYPDSVMQIIDVDLVDGVDANIKAKECCLRSIMGLALECTTDMAEERLDMKNVLLRLKKIKIEYLSNITGEE
ncbi:unnamed protein product [Fraxinus pennsylvanica]|uniref:Protein kinase domain-containing protein n=1 Tax=Fraxinus pennsylvanica TaxID=56036 RepID=A0AAD1YVE5_9LAMI|nr:unnamed protein product [Fraxinus pennsylvanica]